MPLTRIENYILLTNETIGNQHLIPHPHAGVRYQIHNRLVVYQNIAPMSSTRYFARLSFLHYFSCEITCPTIFTEAMATGDTSH